MQQKRLRRSNRTWLALCLLLFPFLIAAPPALTQEEPFVAPAEPAVVDQIARDGHATYWVIMREQANLRGAYRINDWTARGQHVYDALTSLAASSQAGLLSDLQKMGVTHRSFWMLNSIQVTSGQEVLDHIRRQGEVREILAQRVFHVPQPEPADELSQINAVEWGIDRIKAPQVWSTFGTRGEGIVVANIDTGVQFNHSALVAQYRGNAGGGTFDHNYNWFDPSNICGNPSLAPCDNNNHGTHTMGTMVGDDGAANQIGVAPRARWIAAKGCESNSCSDAALLASAQWILAPTNLAGGNPRADLRPHVVNNSWGGGGNDPWYRASVNAWRASGIFPAFSNGNSGPSCTTSGSPGDYDISYSSGAFDINNAIASFSSRGAASGSGIVKPDIAAPGVNVRSSVNGGGYAAFNGTSMASPHTSGAVALMWSAAPALIGDIAATIALLDQTATDTSDLTCGGTAANNNVWGEGKLDVLTAVTQAPRGPTGALQGTVTDSSNGQPVSGAIVQAVGPITRETTTDASGSYAFSAISVGDYNVTVSKFGYATGTASATVTDGGTTTLNFALTSAPSHSVSGFVFDSSSQPLAGATVTILNTPIPPATTGPDGSYSFASVPQGSYSVLATAGRCNDSLTQPLEVTGDVTGFNFTLPQRSDAFGYFCQEQAPAYVEANTVLALTGDDSFASVTLPFPFTFYGTSYSSAFVCTNGYLNFLAGNCTFSNASLPGSAAPNAGIYPFWDDLFVDASASVRTQLLGSAPNRQFVIEWRNVHFFGNSSLRLDFEIILHENGRILTQYRNIGTDAREKGNSATLGIENATGSIALQYSFNQASITSPEHAVLYRLPPSAFVQGVITDVNDGLPLAGATVKALQGSSLVRTATTDASGFYRMQLRLGTYTIEASKPKYSTETAIVTLATEDATYTQNLALKTARGEVSPTSLFFIVPQNQQRTKTLTLRNTGSLDMTWDVNELGAALQAAIAAAATPGPQAMPARNPDHDPNARDAEGLYVEEFRAAALAVPNASGDVIRSWTPTGLALPWGVGFDGTDVWLSDIPDNDRNHEFTVEGTATGVSWPANFGGTWPGDMAYDAGRGWMCQVNVGGDNGIRCWNPATGAETGAIAGAFSWTSISQRGLAYRPDDDSFYIGGWNQGVLYHVAGFSHPTPGTVLGQCNPSDPNISGLAWNPAAGIVWSATNSTTDTIFAIDPATCATQATLAHPSPGFDGGGLEMDAAGNLWMVDQDPKIAYLIDSGIPNFTNVPWLSEDPTSGTVAPGSQQAIQVTADATGLAPGVYTADLLIRTNSGRVSDLRVPVTLVVPAHFIGVNAGGGQYVDVSGETWYADQKHAAGSWGYIQKSPKTVATGSPIAGTLDDPLYKDARRGDVEYRFDGLVPGTYQVDLRFAEIQGAQNRVFDVFVENANVLPGHNIAAAAGVNAANDHTFYVAVTDGSLNVRFVTRRSFKEPLINGIRAIHRPDQ